MSKQPETKSENLGEKKETEFFCPLFGQNGCQKTYPSDSYNETHIDTHLGLIHGVFYSRKNRKKSTMIKKNRKRKNYDTESEEESYDVQEPQKKEKKNQYFERK